MDKIFIAGGTGMLGAATAREFASNGSHVVVSSRKASDEVGELLTRESPLIQVERVDLGDAEAVRALFEKHQFNGMAMVAHTHQYALTRDTNNEIYPLLLNCFESARKTGVKRVIMGGSMAVYGGLTPPFTEAATFPPVVNDPSNADDTVMLKFEVATKRAIEIIALDYGQNFQMGLSVPPGTQKPEPHELEVAVLRAPMMFGPGYKALGSPIGIAAHVAAGRLPMFKGYLAYGGAPVEILWAALASMPVNYVRHNAQCIRIAMEAETLPQPVYNISSGFTRVPREQFEALMKVAPESAERMGISADDLPAQAVDLGFDGAAFRKDFGFSPQHDLEAALAEYVEWLRLHPY
ncbi:MAG: NAD(P)-dependent oxidoreductase [Pseudomonadota bacterium]